MKKIIIFYLFFSSLLIISYGLKQKTPFIYTSQAGIKSILIDYFSNNFTKKTHLNFIFKLLFGFGNLLYYKVNQDIDRLLLWPLISFNGLHIYLFLKSVKLNRFQKFRISYFKVVIWLEKYLTKTYQIYCIVFLGSFIAFYFDSLESYILSLFFIFTFKLIEYKSKLDSILIYSLTYLVIAIYFQKNFSFVACFFSYLIILIYKKFYKIMLIIFISLIYLNHFILDKIAKIIILLFHNAALYTSLDQTSATFFLFISILMFYWKRTRWPFYLYLFFHANWVYSPPIYLSR